jgi:hypothetical protein
MQSTQLVIALGDSITTSHAMSHWMATIGTLVIGCGLTLFYISRRVLATPKSHPFPPGPPGLPWIGNVFGIDLNAPWVTYAEWAKTYGRLLHNQFFP